VHERMRRPVAALVVVWVLLAAMASTMTYPPVSAQDKEIPFEDLTRNHLIQEEEGRQTAQIQNVATVDTLVGPDGQY
jgi:hypothetical protein